VGRVSASKLTTMRDAIARVVHDGDSVCMGTPLEAAIPFAAGHEIIRQRRRDLTLIAPISDMLFDQMIGAGCSRRVVAAWVGNVIAGLGHSYRRAMERGVPHPLAVEDHSNFSVSLALSGGIARRAVHPDALAAGHGPAPDEPDVQDRVRSLLG
jgi:glutaconate CoA-transferase subunit A